MFIVQYEGCTLLCLFNNTLTFMSCYPRSLVSKDFFWINEKLKLMRQRITILLLYQDISHMKRDDREGLLTTG